MKAYDDDEPDQLVLRRNDGMSVEDRVLDYLMSQEPANDIMGDEPLNTENHYIRKILAGGTMTLPLATAVSTHNQFPCFKYFCILTLACLSVTS